MTTIDYTNDTRSEAARIANEERQARNAAVWREVLTKYEKLASHQANYRLLLDYCNGSLSLQAVEYLMQHRPGNLQLDFSDEKPALIEAILAARTWPNPTQERKNLAYKTRVELLDILATMVTKEEFSKYSVAELRAGLAEYRASQQRPGEKVLPAEWTRERLMSRETSSYALKHLIRVYGTTAVNNRLSGRG